MLKDKLQELCELKELVSVYVNLQDRNAFQVGRLLQVDEEYFLMEYIRPNGQDDGITAEVISDIIRVEKNSRYTQKILKLMAQNQEVKRAVSCNGKNLVQAVLQYALERKRIVSIELQRSGGNDVAGFVTAVTKGKYSIQQIDQSGCEAGETPVALEEITRISCDTADERVLLNLYNLGS